MQQQNIVIQRGDDWAQTVTFTFPDATTLVGATAKSQIRRSYKDPTLLANATTTISPPLTCLLQIANTLSAAIAPNCRPEDLPGEPGWESWDLAALEDAIPKFKPWVWDLQITLASGQIRTYVWGYVLVPEEVTLNA